MALQGKYKQAHKIVKIIQWFGCIFLFSIPAMGSLFLFQQPLSVGALKWIQLIQTAAIFLLPPLCMAYLWSEKPIQWLKLNIPNNNLTENAIFLWAIGIMLVALPAINLLSYWNQQMNLPAFLEPLEVWMRTQEESARILTEQFLSANTLGGLLVNLVIMAVLPAVAEELTFRGGVQQLFQPTSKDSNTKNKDMLPHLAIWCSAILFSAIHLQFYGFLPRMLMGALFGYMLVWSGSLWTPILMHFTNNAMAVLIYFLAQHENWDMEKVDAIGTGNTLWLGIVSITLTIIGIYAFRRSTTIRSASSRISNGN